MTETASSSEFLKTSRQFFTPLEADIIGSGDMVQILTEGNRMKTYVVGSTSTSMPGLEAMWRENPSAVSTAIGVLQARESDEKVDIDSLQEGRQKEGEEDVFVGIFGQEGLVYCIQNGISTNMPCGPLNDEGKIDSVAIRFKKNGQEYLLSEEDKNILVARGIYSEIFKPPVFENSIARFDINSSE